MHPRPSAGTESELWPSWRCSMDPPLRFSSRRRAILHRPGAGSAGASCYNSRMVESTRGLLERTADLQTALKGTAESFPFKTELSLVPLLNFYAKKYIDESSAKGVFIRTIRDQVEQVPELLAPITDLS